MQLKYDGPVQIATGLRRSDTHWKNQTVMWSKLLERLEHPQRTSETVKEYSSLPKAKRDLIKDVGGFVGGGLRGGRRKADRVDSRSIITLDADFAPADFVTLVDLAFGDYGYCIYSTHSHNPPAACRYRLLIRLDRDVSPEEYEAAARVAAQRIGIEFFDDTTYQPCRLMYWASCPLDGEYVFDYNDAPPIPLDDLLSYYRQDWHDVSYWPTSTRTVKARETASHKAADPLGKTGIVGAFCRTYNIHSAIAEFLSDIYVQSDTDPNRYTYLPGSTSCGLVVYEDGAIAYSNHSTDPAAGYAMNAFDLVRVHRFGDRDTDADQEKSIVSRPSYKAMAEFASSLDPVKVTLNVERTAAKLEITKKLMASDDADNPQPENPDGGEGANEAVTWAAGLEYSKDGKLKPNLQNVVLILQKDPNLQGIAYNTFATDIELLAPTPWCQNEWQWRADKPSRIWTDADDSQLDSYLASAYTEFSQVKVRTATAKAADDRAFHPVLQYLESLPAWDGMERLDMLFIDTLMADDTVYTRMAARKFCCAAVARIYTPGIKFDSIPILYGGQKIGKSTLFRRLASDAWFNDTLSVTDIKDKTGAEKLQRNWIVEIQEFQGSGQASVKSLRAFVTTQDDRYRAAYGRRVTSHPRQCVIAATSNNMDGLLMDVEGGRRFWPVECKGTGKLPSWSIGIGAEDEEAGIYYRDQIWAEAKYRLAEGEKLMLEGEAAEQAAEIQRHALASDPRESNVYMYADAELPVDWLSRKWDLRLDWLNGNGRSAAPDTCRREFVSMHEIWTECLRLPIAKMQRKDSYDIRRMLEKTDDWDYMGEQKVFAGKDVGYVRGYVNWANVEANIRDYGKSFWGLKK